MGEQACFMDQLCPHCGAHLGDRPGEVARCPRCGLVPGTEDAVAAPPRGRVDLTEPSSSNPADTDDGPG